VRLGHTIALVLALAVCGCQSPAKRSAPAADPLTSDTALPPLANHNTGNQHVELVQFEQAEPLPPPPAPDVIATGGPLTLADLEAIALNNNPTLAAASARIQAAGGRQIQAGLWPNPSAGFQGTEIGSNDTGGAQGGFVSQRFITGGKLRLDQAAAGSELDATQFDFRAQELRVLNDVEVRFYEALVAQRRVELAQELVEIGDGFATATQTLLGGGQVSENDLLQAEIRAENARILFDNARNESLEAWRRLAAVVGTPRAPPMPLAGELDAGLPLRDWESLCGTILAGHPQVEAARARVERARIALLRARREPVPDFDLFVSVRHQDGSGDEIANVLAGVPLPVFDRNQGGIQAAEGEWIAANREVQRIELQLQDQLAVVYRRYASARQQADRYQMRIIPKAEQSLEFVTGGYDKGQVEYLTLLNAQQTYNEVKLSYLDALRELRVALAILEGQLLTDSLAP